MYNTKEAKLPTSWADANSTKASDGDVKIEKQENGHTNVSKNGHTNEHSNGDFNQGAIPESFLEGKSVRTVYGLVPLKYALDWPIFASYDELTGCAAWLGGRIPSFEEARSIYAYVDNTKRKDAERKLGKTVPAVNA